MEDVNTIDISEYDDEDMFLSDVIGDQHDLLFLDGYLRESLGGSNGSGKMGVPASVSAPGATFDEETTI